MNADEAQNYLEANYGALTKAEQALYDLLFVTLQRLAILENKLKHPR